MFPVSQIWVRIDLLLHDNAVRNTVIRSGQFDININHNERRIDESIVYAYKRRPGRKPFNNRHICKGRNIYV